MAILTVCINKQRKRKDGCYSVYIRVAHNGKSVYIPTDKVVGDKGLSTSLEVIDPFVLKPLSSQIITWLDALNRQDTSVWTARQVAEFLKNLNEDLLFSEYARKHIDRLIDNGQERSAKNYKLALQHMERFFGTTQVKFSQLTSANVRKWIESLNSTARAKEMYPVCMRQVFRAAIDELNDYDNGIIKVKTNPWGKVRIPASDRPNKKAITAEACRAFFSAPLPETRMIDPLPELGRDVAMMVLCLAGMNTVDIFNLRKQDYHGGVIHYRRTKTTKSRTDGAYIEMRVPEVIKPLFEKYRAGDHTDRLFRFCDRFSTSDSFCSNVNTGIKQICKSMGLPKEQWYCVYTFRHTWATTAQNDCGATLAEVGFAMNHSHRYTVTRGYVQLDFSPAWRLNEQVIDFILFSDATSRRMELEKPEDDGLFCLSTKMLIRAAAFFQGKCLANFEDIGYSNIEEVTKALVAQFPADIPNRSMVQFKIVNCDNGKVHVYEHQKGKGF
ncbi:phage integrase SAM-like domain-containing protein [uncultured Duncaniella sp.]|uniref:phage integrase SAM-like domain-containing protein n=1 Tax=uncultured Duncaniella sp. TaxID=2768039 RepID=UPI002603B120|nr:phage integrase SAM-like domain-containing protein [uncultured Duncaniella sp.]